MKPPEADPPAARGGVFAGAGGFATPSYQKEERK